MNVRSVAFASLGLAATLLLTCCSGEPDLTPAQVAEAYLRAGSTQNEEEVRANLDPACHTDERMVRADSIRMMGAPITIETITVTQESATEETASVSFEVGGPVHSTGGTQEMLGVEITTGAVNIDHAERSGRLELRRVDDRWMVGCR